MQVQIQRGSLLRQFNYSSQKYPGTTEGGSILEREDALEADRSGLKCPLCHLLHVILSQLCKPPRAWPPHLQNGNITG